MLGLAKRRNTLCSGLHSLQSMRVFSKSVSLQVMVRDMLFRTVGYRLGFGTNALTQDPAILGKVMTYHAVEKELVPNKVPEPQCVKMSQLLPLVPHHCQYVIVDVTVESVWTQGLSGTHVSSCILERVENVHVVSVPVLFLTADHTCDKTCWRCPR